MFNSMGKCRLYKGEKRMVKQFEDGKVYVLKGSKKPYEEIIEAAFYKSKMIPGRLKKT